MDPIGHDVAKGAKRSFLTPIKPTSGTRLAAVSGDNYFFPSRGILIVADHSRPDCGTWDRIRCAREWSDKRPNYRWSSAAGRCSGFEDPWLDVEEPPFEIPNALKKPPLKAIPSG